MNLNQHYPRYLHINQTVKQKTRQPSFPSTYLSPELYLLIELEVQSNPSPKQKLLAFFCVIVTVSLFTCGLFLQYSQLQSLDQNSAIVANNFELVDNDN